MPKVIVASTNPVKINAAKAGFEKMLKGEVYEFEGVKAASGVSDQPLSNVDTFRGAINRAENAAKQYPGADYYVGMEGGVEDSPGGMQSFAWIAVRDKNGKIGKSRTAVFFLPEKIAEIVRSGKELGDADDIVFGMSNSKQGIGSIGILTKEVVDRTDYYTTATIFALIPFVNPELY